MALSTQPDSDTGTTAEIDLLCRLVEIPSLSGEEANAVSFLLGAMDSLGFRTRTDAAGNAIGEIGEGPGHIVLLGHIDTVPGDIPVRIDDGILHGRGAVDAKGPLATFVSAAARAAADTIRITVVGATGEESIGSPGAKEVATWTPPDYCIIGEPSGWSAICLGYRGTASFVYEIRQASRHTAGPGDSVAEQGVAYWNALSDMLDDRNGENTGFNSIGKSLRSFHADGDGMYDTASLSIGLRLPPDCPSSSLIQPIRHLSSDGDLTLDGVQEGYQTDKRSKLTPPFLRAIRGAGGTPRFTRKLGTSDMTIVGPVWQCPIIAYGPGDASLDHTPEEHIVLSEYLQAIDILASVLRDLK